MASHRISPAPALGSSFSARCACGYTPENAPRSSRSSRNSPGHFFAKALLRGKTGRGPDDGIGSAEWGEPGPPLSASDAGAVRAASRCALTIRSPRRAPAASGTASPLPRAPPPPRRREKPWARHKGKPRSLGDQSEGGGAQESSEALAEGARRIRHEHYTGF